MSVKTITEPQLDATKEKVRGNIRRMLDFLHDCLGHPECPNHAVKNVHVNEMYSVFTHAVEEYGKMLYLESLEPNESGSYKVDYASKFCNHKHKFNRALEKLPPSIKDVYDKPPSEEMWERRLNILNVDLDSNGDPTRIDLHVNIDKLRQSVWNFRSRRF